MERLKKAFVEPPDECTPIPFWFWNDALTETEILRQIGEFRKKGVMGFVIHPRMGIPREMPYMSEAYLDLVEAAVAEAAKHGMLVILYDEGMYPSGSANGQVVKTNPEFASRGLRMEEHPCVPEGGRPPDEGDSRRAGEADASTGKPAPDQAASASAGMSASGCTAAPSLAEGERIVLAAAVKKRGEQVIEPARTMILEAGRDGRASFAPPDGGPWSIVYVIETLTNGTIRGIHEGQDDGEPDAPLAADLLNAEATACFIRLTHDRYYARLKPYFGSTVMAFFTDEPNLKGRGGRKGVMPWTSGFMQEFVGGGNAETDLPLLWFDGEQADSGTVRKRYKDAVRQRLQSAYYKPLSDWCGERGIALTGHPAESDDIGLLKYFQLPGQDVVWRHVAPEDGKALNGRHSTQGKCSSDSARHRGRRRNLNECFGACGRDSGWTFTADEMKWYLDWLLVRGVNLIVPHAFYYSIREERRNERPPDVGMNSIWWPDYDRISRYIKRMCWVMTDSRNTAETAVLTQDEQIPWRSVKPLFENQLEFNYLEEDLLPECELAGGKLHFAGYAYKAVIVEHPRHWKKETLELLDRFAGQGGLVIECGGSIEEERAGSGSMEEDSESGHDRDSLTDGLPLPAESLSPSRFRSCPIGHISDLLRETVEAALLQPVSPDIRISCVLKDGVIVYVIVNEGEAPYDGRLLVPYEGEAEIWNPWEGTMSPASGQLLGRKLGLHIRVERRESVWIVIDPKRPFTGTASGALKLASTFEVKGAWEVSGLPAVERLERLGSWTELQGLEHYSGTAVYETSFEFAGAPGRFREIRLELGQVHERAKVTLNGQEAGVRLWSPYTYEVKPMLKEATNRLRIEVTNSLANGYDGMSHPSGLLGPVRIGCYE